MMTVVTLILVIAIVAGIIVNAIGTTIAIRAERQRERRPPRHGTSSTGQVRDATERNEEARSE